LVRRRTRFGAFVARHHFLETDLVQDAVGGVRVKKPVQSPDGTTYHLPTGDPDRVRQAQQRLVRASPENRVPRRLIRGVVPEALSQEQQERIAKLLAEYYQQEDPDPTQRLAASDKSDLRLHFLQSLRQDPVYCKDMTGLADYGVLQAMFNYVNADALREPSPPDPRMRSGRPTPNARQLGTANWVPRKPPHSLLSRPWLDHPPATGTWTLGRASRGALAGGSGSCAPLRSLCSSLCCFASCVGALSTLGGSFEP